jgi:hypothetical protein
MRSSICALVALAGCTGASHELDASGDAQITIPDGGPTDAGPDAPPDGGRVPVVECPDLVHSSGAFVGSGTPENGYPIQCERLLDAPSFVELGDTPVLCDGAVEHDLTLTVPTPIEIADVDCEGMTLRGETGSFRVRFGDSAGVAAQVANLTVDHLVAGARVRDGRCTRFLSIFAAPDAPRYGWTDILDFPPEGGELWLDDAEGSREPRWLRVTPVAGSAAPCTSLRSACIEGTVVAGGGAIAEGTFAIEPCGGTWLPLAGCGDGAFTAVVGSDACGGRLHAMFSPAYYVPICH